MPRRWGVVLAVLVLVLASCSGDDDDAVADEGPTTIPPARTTLRVGVEEWPECLNPITCDSPALREQILQHVLPVAFEVDEAGEYRPSPLLEDEPEVDIRADGMIIEYRLAARARWDDGQPITSSDFRATWQAFVNTPGADATGYDSITAIDDADPRVAVVELSEPYGDWRTLFGGGVGWVLEADAFGGSTDLTGQFEDELPFSAAPYRLVEWDGETAVLAGVEEYWEPSRLAGVDQVRMTLVTVDELAQPAVFDLLVPAGRTDAPEGFSTRRLAGSEVLGVWFDQRTPLLANVTHRRALSAMIDREVLIGEATDEDRAPIECLGWVPGVGPWCDAAEADPIEPDSDLASYVLALEGWVPGEGGDLFRDGQPFSVPLRYDPNVPGAEAIADALVEAFAAGGIATVLQPTLTASWIEERAAERETGVGVFPFDLGVSPQVFDLYGCRNGPASSVLAWCPSEVVEPTDALRLTASRDEQLELVEEIGTAAAEAATWIPVVRLSSTYHVQTDRVQVPDDRSALGGPLGRLHAFSVDG